MQDGHDLWQARKRVELSDVEQIKLSAAQQLATGKERLSE
jgi:hypothetical protein